MSSILEALRELENDRAATTTRVTLPLEAGGVPHRGAQTAMIALGGVALGILGFVTLLWVAERGGQAPVIVSTPSPAPPAWLDRAEAPRGLLGGAGAPPPLERPRRLQASTPPRTTPLPAQSAPRVEGSEAALPGSNQEATTTADQIQIEAIHYVSDVASRRVALRVNGQRVTLRQSESVGGVQVQLIGPAGIYVQRGGDVFLITPGH